MSKPIDSDSAIPKGLTPAERAALMPTVIALRFQGGTEKSISQELNISTRQVRNILNDPAYDDLLKEIQNQALKHSMASFRGELDKMSPLAVKALRLNLEEGKIEAVKLYTQLIGALKPEERAEQAQQIQVVLPDGLVREI